MRKLRTAVLASIAALGVAGMAMAASNESKLLHVNLPDGSVARIQYWGDVAPTVIVEPSLRLLPVQFVHPADTSPMALFDELLADMNRNAAAMLHHVEALSLPTHAAQPALDWASFGNLPEGTVSYRFVSTSDGERVCSQSWQLTSQGSDKQPKLVSTRSGDCGSDASATGADQVTLPESLTPQRDGSPATMV